VVAGGREKQVKLMKIRPKSVLFAAALTGLLAGCASQSNNKMECKKPLSTDMKGDKDSCGTKGNCTSKATCRSKGNCNTKGS
jgi:hypothetical protein